MNVDGDGKGFFIPELVKMTMFCFREEWEFFKLS
jgi:hypothetical protein